MTFRAYGLYWQDNPANGLAVSHIKPRDEQDAIHMAENANAAGLHDAEPRFEGKQHLLDHDGWRVVADYETVWSARTGGIFTKHDGQGWGIKS